LPLVQVWVKILVSLISEGMKGSGTITLPIEENLISINVQILLFCYTNHISFGVFMDLGFPCTAKRPLTKDTGCFWRWLTKLQILTQKKETILLLPPM
jgi:hypothetical protein